MEKIFGNLHLYEIVLLFLGVFLFMLLCGGLVYYIIQKENIKKLLLFFPIPILMIGYPSIQEIQIENDKVALKKFSKEVIENPEDTIAKQELSKITEKLEKRAANVEDIKAVAKANLLLGNPDKAIDLTNKAIQINKGEPLKKILTDSMKSLEQQQSKENLLTIEDIKAIATIQKKLDNRSLSSDDTSRLREQINKIQWSDPKMKEYLRDRILENNIKTDTIEK
ncbi:hypothetical protein [Aquimarina longa]|uniref:hypothetical protein n=1 Tax=Aquimarina longa TaxID=1080221 RepID=UPI000A9C9D10|nr:hypothetical protein [Aquimarina longa]